jgi:hypothetical protein
MWCVGADRRESAREFVSGRLDLLLDMVDAARDVGVPAGSQVRAGGDVNGVADQAHAGASGQDA